MAIDFDNEAVGAASAVPLPGKTSARARWSTLAYAEKVRPQFLSLRHSYRPRNFSINE